MARGIEGRRIFMDNRDFQTFLNVLHRVRIETASDIVAYCLMTNHFHLLIRVNAVSLSNILHKILTTYAITFNRRHNRKGHLFEDRYKAIPCLTDRYLLTLIRYIQENPVRAGLASQPNQWPWASRSAVDLPDFDSAGFNPWMDSSAKPTLIRSSPTISTLDVIGARVAADCRIDVEKLKERRKIALVVRAKRAFSQEAFRHGHTMTDIAKWLNTALSSVRHYMNSELAN
jgi:REP element-mobilizing transposase RayT